MMEAAKANARFFKDVAPDDLQIDETFLAAARDGVATDRRLRGAAHELASPDVRRKYTKINIIFLRLNILIIILCLSGLKPVLLVYYYCY